MRQRYRYNFNGEITVEIWKKSFHTPRNYAEDCGYQGVLTQIVIEQIIWNFKSLYADILENNYWTNRLIYPLNKINITFGFVFKIPSENATSGSCSPLKHTVVASGFKGYVNYLSSRVPSTLPYVIDGDETFLLHHLDKTKKDNNVQLSVELSSKSCHCLKGLDIKVHTCI